LLTFCGEDGPQRVGDDDVLQVKLGIGVAICGEAPALRMAPAAAVMTGDPPPSSDSARKALVWWVNRAA
jgi:hypothetical protein